MTMTRDTEGTGDHSLGDRRFVRNMDWNLLKIFHEIVRSGGVTNAANAMSRQQPAVSGALKRLEDYLGKYLCDRGPGGFSLTDHGARLAEIVAEIDSLITSLKTEFDSIDNDLSIQLQIATVGNVVSSRLDCAIREFAAAYPKAELYIRVAPQPEIEDLVLSGEADIGVCPDPRMDSRLEYYFLNTERHQVVCGSKHRLAGRHISDYSALSEEAFIVPGTDEVAIVRDFRHRYGWGKHKAGQSLDIGEVKRLLHAGVGIALLPTDMVQRELADGHFWAVTKPIEGLVDDIYMVANAGANRHFAARRFLELIPPQDAENSVS